MKVLEGLNFGVVWSHAPGSEDCTIKGNLRLPALALSIVKDVAMFLSSLH